MLSRMIIIKNQADGIKNPTHLKSGTKIELKNIEQIEMSHRDSSAINSNWNQTGAATMKSGNRDKAEGKMHQVKGKFKETAGIIAGNHDLEAKGKEEKIEGKIQEKLGQIKKVMDK